MAPDSNMAESNIYVRKDYSALDGLLAGERQVFLVYDRNVTHIAQGLARRIGAKTACPAGVCPQDGGENGLSCGYAVVADEGNKTMEAVLGICRWLLESGADRDALLLALGGGVTTDIAGFAACIYKRGIRFATLPTTLLSQIDAGIGGKTGVNLDSYKNILGCIRQPEFVYIATDALESLPEREYLSGVAELLKTFVIADAPHYRRAVAMLSRPEAGVETVDGLPVRIPGGGRVDAELIQTAARIKEGVVSRDECESGERRKLNLGHTVAHAIEWWQTRRTGAKTACPAGVFPQDDTKNGLSCGYTHGEAVAIGMVMAARVSESLGVCRKGLAALLEADFAALGLPTECPASIEELAPAIGKDKKAVGDSVNCVLIRDIGSVEVRPIPKDRLLQLLDLCKQD